MGATPPPAARGGDIKAGRGCGDWYTGVYTMYVGEEVGWCGDGCGWYMAAELELKSFKKLVGNYHVGIKLFIIWKIS